MFNQRCLGSRSQSRGEKWEKTAGRMQMSWVTFLQIVKEIHWNKFGLDFTTRPLMLMSFPLTSVNLVMHLGHRGPSNPLHETLEKPYFGLLKTRQTIKTSFATSLSPLFCCIWLLEMSFYSLLKILFIYFIIDCSMSLLFRVGFLQLSWAGVSLHRSVWASHWGGFSYCGAPAAGARASIVHHVGTVVVHGLSCSAACGIFPDQGLNPCSLGG